MRKQGIATVALAALGLATGAAAQTNAKSAPIPVSADIPAVPVSADFVLRNGHVYTPSGWVGNVAIHKGVIIALGDEQAIQPVVDAATRVIDLHGKTVLPGLYDMHVHATGAGLRAMQCRLPQGSSPQQIFALTAACVRERKPGEWITGRAWSAGSFGATPPNRQMLDKVAPDNPVMYDDIGGHSSWANSYALKLAGITRDTPNPPNGVVEKDAKGEPTGLLRESAVGLVSKKLPLPTREQAARALKWSLDTMLSEGIVSFEDALTTTGAAQAYADLADRGQLHQRVRACLVSQDAALVASRGIYARDRFSPSCVKIILDGVPNDGHTAALLDNYVPVPGRDETGREKGLMFVDPADLAILVTRFDAMGLTVKMHAAGDAAVHEGLDAIAAARKANGFTGVLHNLAHDSFVRVDDIKRARSIGAVFEMSPYVWFNSPIVGDIRKAVGEERMKRFIPVKEALDAGDFVVFGSDWDVVPTVNPWIGIETLVTRRVPGGGGQALAAQEGITLKQAIDGFTINAARLQYAAHQRGSIELGKLADLVVIDRDIFAVPITTVHETKVLMTIINGEVVYDGSHPPAARP